MDNKTNKPTEEQAQLIAILTARFGKSVEEWKKEYAPRKLNIIEVEDKIAVLRPIGAKEVGNYSVMLVDETKGVDVAIRYLLEELWLDGDNDLRDNEEYFISAMLQLQNLIQVKTSRFTQL